MTVNQAEAHFQGKMGIGNKAKVKVYQGDDENIEGTVYASHNASFDKETNTINYNIDRKGFNKVETVTRYLAHKSVQKLLEIVHKFVTLCKVI